MEENEQHHLPVGTEVSAKYRGAFCEAKIKSLKKIVVFKVSIKKDSKTYTVADDCVKGQSKVGSIVEVQVPELNGWHDAVIIGVKDKSVYTVEFDDGDERTLSRGSLCLQGVRHFAEGDTLDHLPLTDPENFGTPVLNWKRKAKKKQLQTPDAEGEPDSDDEKISEVESSNKRKITASKSEPKPEATESASTAEMRKKWLSDRLMGNLVLVEPTDKRKHWYPAICINPLCIDEKGGNLRENEIVIRSLKTGKIAKVLRCDRLTRSNTPSKVEPVWKDCLDTAFLWEETGTIPDVWKMDIRHIRDDSREESPRNKESEEDEEKNNDFLEQLYKFMEDCGCSINKTPVLGYKDLDLFLLYNLVQTKGGFHNITSPADWREIYSDLGIPKLTQAAGHHAKMAYSKYLLNFEEYMKTFERSHKNNTSKSRLEVKASRRLSKARSFRAENDAEPASRRVSRRRKLSETVSVVDENEISLSSKDNKRNRKSKIDLEFKRDSDIDDTSSTASSEKSITRSKSSTSSSNEVMENHKPTDRKRSNSGRKQPFYKPGDKLRVKYGKDSFKLYCAKVVDVEVEENEVQYYVHYAGWNSRHDEWIKPWRISSYVGDKNDSTNFLASSSKPTLRRSMTPTLNEVKNLDGQLPSTAVVKLVQDDKFKGVDPSSAANKAIAGEKKAGESKLIKIYQSQSKNVDEKLVEKGRIRRRSTSSSTPLLHSESCHIKRATSVEKLISNEIKTDTKDCFITREEKSPKRNDHPAVPLGLFPVHRRTSGRRSKSPAYLKESALYGLTKRKRNSNSVSNDTAPPSEVHNLDDLSSEASSPFEGSEASRASPLTVWSEADNYIEKNLKPDRRQTQRKSAQSKKLFQSHEERTSVNTSDVKNETYDNFDDEAPKIELETKNNLTDVKTECVDLQKESNPEPLASMLDYPIREEQLDANEETGEETQNNSQEEEKKEDTSTSSGENSSSSSDTNNNVTKSGASSSAIPTSSNNVETSPQMHQNSDEATSSSKTLMENTPPITPDQSPQHSFNEPENNLESGAGLSSEVNAPASETLDKVCTTEKSGENDVESKFPSQKRIHSGSQQSPHRTVAKNAESDQTKRENVGESDSDEDGYKNKPKKRKKPKKKPKRDPPTAPAPISHQELSTMTPDQKIQVLQNKLTEMRNVYQQLKQEVSSIDRKRKRAKRREQEALERSSKNNASLTSPTKPLLAGNQQGNVGGENASLDVETVSA